MNSSDVSVNKEQVYDEESRKLSISGLTKNENFENL